MAQPYVQQLLKGIVEPLLLFIISELPVHGYQIAKELDKRSQGYFEFKGSTIYSALRRLEKEGLVLSAWQQVTQKQKRRCYELTEKGRQILTERLGEWQHFYEAACKIIGYQKLSLQPKTK
jgi:DNA-binding PadR family transcriptional regulator